MTARLFRLWPCLAALLTLILPTLTHAATLNVPSAAYPTIQSGVDASQDGDTVLVADGTYTGDGNRDIDFNGKNITVTSQNGPAKTIIDCGGYASTDGSGNHRGFYVHSGEKNATISGFSVKNGYETSVFNGFSDSSYGGGIYVELYISSGVFTINNCIVTGNTASSGGTADKNSAWGGGIWNSLSGNGRIALSNCVVSGNAVSSGGNATNIFSHGGGIANQSFGGGQITLNNCIVAGNTATSSGTANITSSDGGGIVNQSRDGGQIALNYCAIAGNTAVAIPDSSGDTNASFGGGVSNYMASQSSEENNTSITLNNCTIHGNTAAFCGGVENEGYPSGSGNITLANCSITENNAQISGGGVSNGANNANETITLANCAITENVAPTGYGGGVLNNTDGGTILMTDCAVTGNRAAYGGGLSNFNDQSGLTAITNCTIAANVAAKIGTGEGGMGGGVYNDNSYDNTSSTSGGTTTLTNCTVSKNSAFQGGGIYNDNYYADGSILVLTNCILYSDTGGESYNSAGNSLGISFCDLQGGSPGTGNINKDPLFVNAATGDLHLKPGSPCLGKGTHSGAPATDKDGRTRPNPPSMGAYELAATLQIPAQYPTIQSAVTAARSGDTVMVAAGTYTGPGNVDWDFGGKDVTVKSADGAANTIIDCGGAPSTDGSGNHRGFYIHSGETNAVIDGITVENGYESSVAGIADSGYGGSICVDGSSAAIKNCVFTGSTATIAGGGVAAIGKGHHSITFTNCVFTKNNAPNGGGVYSSNDGSTISLINSSVSGNTARNGGGVCNKNSGGSTSLTSCSVAGNTAQNSGGGIYNENDLDGDTITVINCSVSGNASPLGGGVYDFNSTSDDTILLINDIVYGDRGGEVSDNPLTASATSITFSDIQGGHSGTGSINADPLFVNVASGDLHLKPGSPCLGKGTPDGAPTTDKDGNTRPNPPSMGAYELVIPPATIIGFTLSPAQIDAPAPKVTVTADVTTVGNFSKVTVSPAPGSLSSASPTFTLVNSGTDWKGSLPTAYLKLAKTNPITFIATGTRTDGTTATTTATLIIGALPALSLAVSSDKSAIPAGQTFSMKGFVRNLTATIATPVTVIIPLPAYLSFVSSPDFTFNPVQNTVTWTGPLAANNGSHAISVEFRASASTPINKQIAINVTASAPDFQSITQSASIVVGAPPAPLGVDIDASGAAGQADGTAIITSTVGVAPLRAVISPVSGLGHAWLGVDHAYDEGGGQLAPTTDASIGTLAAVLGVVGPGASPTYAASFSRIGSQCNIGLRLTNVSAALNIDSIAVSALSGLLGAQKGDPAEVFEFYDEFQKIPAFKDAADQLMHPATTPWGKAKQAAHIVKDFLDLNPNDLDTLAIYFSGKTGKVITAGGVKKALSAIGAGQAIFEIVQIVADEISFTISTGGADAEIKFTGSAASHPEEQR